MPQGRIPGRRSGRGADSIADVAILRHDAMTTVFDHPYAPSTLGSFLREFRFGHVRQLDAVASRLLCALTDRTSLLAGIDTDRAMADIDDSIVEVHGHSKQGSGYGYSGIRGLISLLTNDTAAPVITGQRLRIGPKSSTDDRRQSHHRRTTAQTVWLARVITRE